MAADSRSSLLTSDGKALSWEDNFTKIAYLPKAEIAVISAEINRIEGDDIITFLLNNDSSQFAHDAKRGLEYFRKLIWEKQSYLVIYALPLLMNQRC